jgi:pimeloyl-ACP methyl ester carboxylesterase
MSGFMRQTNVTVISIALLIYAGFCVFFYASQRNAIYYPTLEVQEADAADIRLESDGETLKIWRLAHAGGTNAIIYFGGNAEDVSGNIPDFRNFFPGHNVYLVNYRGYGGSTGSPSEAGLYKDALAIFDEIRTRYTSISVIGRSLGSGVATYLAAVRDIDKLVLITPFDSIENVAKKALPVLPVSLLLKDKFDSVGRVADIAAPVLVVTAEYDEVIPSRHSVALAEAFPKSQVTVEVISDAGHNTIEMSPRYAHVLSMFLATRASQ